MKALNCIMALAVILYAHLCSGADSAGSAKARPSLEEAHQAYLSLLQVRTFAFGGVGIGGVTSEGEKAFRKILASTNALPLFQKALANGSSEAKLYALCGIRHLDKRSFERASKALLAADPVVTTMAGCFVGREKAAEIVKRIAEGVHDTDILGNRLRKP